jgi:hypothetical protein
LASPVGLEFPHVIPVSLNLLLLSVVPVKVMKADRNFFKFIVINIRLAIVWYVWTSVHNQWSKRQKAERIMYFVVGSDAVKTEDCY